MISSVKTRPRRKSDGMTKEQFLQWNLERYGITPDYPFEDLEAAVLRHRDNRKWYALLMRVSRRKFGQKGEETVDVVNLKLPPELFGSFGAGEGVYPAYHMNKLHWVSVILSDAGEDTVRFLLNASYEVTAGHPRQKKR